MTPSRSELRLSDADELYAELIDAHHGLSREDSEKLNARLILLLINEIGDAEIVRSALRAARTTARPNPPEGAQPVSTSNTSVSAPRPIGG